MTDQPTIAPEAVAAILKDVTPGPWGCNVRGFVGPVSDADDQSFGMICDEVAECTHSGGAKEANARFIAWARNNIEALAADHDAQKARADAAEAERDELRAAIFGGDGSYDSTLRNGNFREMAETLHAAHLGAMQRAEAAEAKGAKLVEASAKMVEAVVMECDFDEHSAEFVRRYTAARLAIAEAQE